MATSSWTYATTLPGEIGFLTEMGEKSHDTDVSAGCNYGVGSLIPDTVGPRQGECGFAVNQQLSVCVCVCVFLPRRQKSRNGPFGAGSEDETFEFTAQFQENVERKKNRKRLPLPFIFLFKKKNTRSENTKTIIFPICPGICIMSGINITSRHL